MASLSLRNLGWSCTQLGVELEISSESCLLSSGAFGRLAAICGTTTNELSHWTGATSKRQATRDKQQGKPKHNEQTIAVSLRDNRDRETRMRDKLGGRARHSIQLGRPAGWPARRQTGHKLRSQKSEWLSCWNCTSSSQVSTRNSQFSALSFRLLAARRAWVNWSAGRSKDTLDTLDTLGSSAAASWIHELGIRANWAAATQQRALSTFGLVRAA